MSVCANAFAECGDQVVDGQQACGHIIQGTGITIRQKPILNFATGFTVVNVGNKTNVYATATSGAASSAGAVTKDISQASHGLSVGDVVRFNGTNYVKAQADSASNAEVVGIVSTVADASNFTLTTHGYVSGLSGLAAGSTYFLSESSAGALTATDPSGSNVSKPLFTAISTTTGYFINYRGLISSSTSNTTSIGVTFDGGGSVPSATTRYIQTPYGGTINQWHMFLDQTGSATVDVWRDTETNYPPTVLDSIVGSEMPIGTSVAATRDTTLTTWTLPFSQGDVFGFRLVGATTATTVLVQLWLNKT